MDAPHSINLPLPPRAKQIPGEHDPEPEDIIVTMDDSTTRTGKLIRFVDTENSFELLNEETGKVDKVLFSSVKSFQLMNSRHLVLDEGYISSDANEITLPSERQEYYLEFSDGTEENGESLGSVSDAKGIHLFIAQAFYNYYHMFVPFSSIKNQRIGAVLGEALVKNNLVLQEDIEKGLNKQSELRNKKLGEYLTAEEIVSSTELEKAIKRQESTPNLRLGEALIQENLITETQLENALTEQQNNRSIPLGEILIQMGAVSMENMKKTLASKLGIPYVNLRKFKIEDNIVKMVPEKICRRHNLIPLCIYESKLIVAIENPLNRLPMEDLRFHTKIFVEPVMASSDDIEWAINLYYSAQINELALELDDDDDDQDDFQNNIGESDNALVKLVNKMIIDAHAQGASDIHIEPYPGKRKTIVRFRKDGELIPYVELPPNYRNALVSRIKIMCDLDISDRRKPQDGKIDFKKFGPLKIELRVATIPTAGGVEDVVLRVLANGEPIPLDQMGIRTRSLEDIKKQVSKPFGLFLVCGPTGSGKTTTLHSILGYINTPDKKIWTAEDPVEITQKGLRQLQVNSKIDLSFANAMRAFLRADPDVIMVGEMRDAETTSTGIEASLTGHLVLSTLHTNSAPESIVRLLDMGMDPFNFADALLGILAQRLTKRLCPLCKTEHPASDEELVDLANEYCEDIFHNMPEEEQIITRKEVIADWKNRLGLNGELKIYTANGCDECGNS
ncbi:MAG: ATPase, T2SS/T4P/T4SS family, partial [Gammaproteobacteria bacterium]|nr:ATPase, T2SS/T4P/T4SS family [Gammaproteobacteria bacterium]